MNTSPTSLLAHQTAVLGIILTSYLLIILDVSIVITGLPRIQEELQFSQAQLAWVQSVYTLFFGGFLLLGARAGDILGRRRMFQTGLAVFTIASLAVGLAPSANWMVAARAVQGVGAAILAPSSLALLAIHFPEGPQRRRATSLYGAVAGIGASIGLVMGGLLADLWSWRVGFFINVPVGIVLALAGARYIEESERHAGDFDLLGAVLSTAGFGALIWGIVNLGDVGWQDLPSRIAVVIGLALIVLFITHESRAPQPIMPLHLFRHQARSAAYLARFLLLGGMVTFFFYSTQFMQSVLGFSALEAGLGFLPMTLVNFVSALYGSKLLPKAGPTAQTLTGLMLIVAGMAWLSQVDASATYLLDVALPMVLIGAGQGLCFGPLTAAGVVGTTRQDAGAASGVVNVAHQLGSSAGLGAMAALATAAQAGGSGAAAAARGVSAALQGGTVLLGLAAAVAMILFASNLRPTGGAEPGVE
ncbi:MFS transporter [Stenotrophomonas sp. Sa5BUN4]|uniref:MFS transporter n=1 Tax=Stenotrophomonas lacuserhaii TaxID=2760084 RepID=A0A8X8K2G7_9GAMM|nr:MFS transporter [Stenotrophomonas pennii]MBD7952999.1 MFS transporter [Stenotrophomonas pennii]